MLRSGQTYFIEEQGAPAPLQTETRARVRFEEVDSLGMVWHGRYASYFEDGRRAFGDRYGLTYMCFRQHRTVAPIVQLHVDFRHPLRFDEEITIETSLHWTEAARLNFSYRVFNQQAQLAARGYTVQLFTEPEGSIMLLTPKWLQEFKARWQGDEWRS